MNIFQKINAIQKKVRYIQKDAKISGGGTYKAVTHDFLVSKIREHLVEEGIVVYPRQLTGEMQAEGATSKGTPMYLYHGMYEIVFMNIEDKDDFFIAQVGAHGQDTGDKGPGKAVTYATKSAMLKVFCLETGDNEESRKVGNEPYTDHQYDTFKELLLEKRSVEFVAFIHTVGPDIYTALYNSGEKGEKVKLKQECKELEAAGHATIEDYATQIIEGVKADDPDVMNLVEELQDTEKRLIANRLTDVELDWIKAKREELGI